MSLEHPNSSVEKKISMLKPTLVALLGGAIISLTLYNIEPINRAFEQFENLEANTQEQLIDQEKDHAVTYLERNKGDLTGLVKTYGENTSKLAIEHRVNRAIEYFSRNHGTKAVDIMLQEIEKENGVVIATKIKQELIKNGVEYINKHVKEEGKMDDFLYASAVYYGEDLYKGIENKVIQNAVDYYKNNVKKLGEDKTLENMEKFNSYDIYVKATQKIGAMMPDLAQNDPNYKNY